MTAATGLTGFEGTCGEGHEDVFRAMLAAFDTGHVGLCLCDAGDVIRYANTAFRNAFLPGLRDIGRDFTEAVAAVIAEGRGIRLSSMPLEVFVPRIRERRRNGPARVDFAVDMVDGTWWWVNDHRLENGWLLVVASEITALKHEEARLRDAHAEALRDALTDVLTGVANRRHGMVLLDMALAEHAGNRLPLSVAIIDIDHFKRINDLNGHDAGDRVLRVFAEGLSEHAGPRSHVARLGGEEFLVVMPATEPGRGRIMLDGFMASLSALEEVLGAPDLAFSCGLTAATPDETRETLLARADRALYRAKALGRARIEVDEAAPVNGSPPA